MDDKDKHKAVSTLITLISGGALFYLTNSLYTAMIGGGLIGMLAGVLKEFYDLKIKKTKFDWWDIGADVFGVGMGLIILRVALELFI